MGIYIFLTFLSIAFFEMFVLLRMKKDTTEIVSSSLESMRVLSSSEIGDRDKETLMRRASIKIVKTTARFALKLLFIGALLYLSFRTFTALVPSIENELIDSLISPATIALLTMALLLYGWVRKVVLKWLPSFTV